MFPDQFHGALLVGGRSQRMGQRKEHLQRGSQTMGEYLCDLLYQSTGRPTIILGKSPLFQESAHQINDPGQGPLKALITLFEQRPQQHFVVLATDLPLMNQEALAWLMDQARTRPEPVIWPRLPERDFGEPLAAIYKAEALPELHGAWARGIRAIKNAVVPKNRFEPEIPPHLCSCFTNVNTPESWDKAQKLLDLG